MRTCLALLLLAAAAPALRAQSEPVPATVSLEQFKGIRWILGRWVGAGVGRLASVKAFWEEYTLENDSTIQMRSYQDSTFTTVSESHAIQLRGGQVRSGTSVATRFTGDTVHFTASSGRRYVFARLSADHWRADFARPGETEPMYYDMRRVPERP